MKQVSYSFSKVFLAIALLFLMTRTFAYEEAAYKTVFQSDKFDVRFYEERLVIQTKYANQNGGFRKLFNYISGSNEGSQEISMTIPVTQSKSGDGMIMQFYLPSSFDELNAPSPDDNSLEISSIDEGHYAAIRFSGRSTEKNFTKYSETLKKDLERENILIIGPAIKATYNGPLTLPLFRRNESMFLVDWE